MRYQRDSGNTSTSNLFTLLRLDSASSIPLAGQTVTFSFYAKAGANYSATSNALVMSFYSGTGTDQGGYPSTWTGSTGLVSSQSFSLTTSWQRFSVSFAVGSTATQLGALFTFTPTGTASTNDYFEITGVQLEAGSTATSFKRNAPSIQAELAACQRYYLRYTSADHVYSRFGTGFSETTGGATFQIPLKQTMRVAPTSIDTSSSLVVYDGTSFFTAGTWTISNTNRDSITIAYSKAGMTQYRPSFIIANNSTAEYLGFNAEL